MSTKAAHTRVGVVMISPESRLFCRLDGSTPAAREQQRFKALVELGLLRAETVPVFDEATQTAAGVLEAAICILGLMTQERQWIKSAVGLSRAGLMNELAVSRQLRRHETFCTYVIDSHQPLAIDDTATNPVFANSILFQYYGIRAYLGVPLLTASGQCLGTLAVMDMMPRSFSAKDINYLVLMARWVIGEVERSSILKAQSTNVLGQGYSRSFGISKSTVQQTNGHLPIPETNTLKVKLFAHLSQELRTPLTSVMGMTSVLRREIYGPLSSKQKDYLEIIHDSGQHLIELVDEILALDVLDGNSHIVNPTSVDIEMLCQQAINRLDAIVKQRQQQIDLSVEPGHRIWLLDKEKVRQILYYLLFSMIQSTEVGYVIRIHVSSKSNKLNIALWASQPWLENSIPQVALYSQSEVYATSNCLEAVPALSYAEYKQQAEISTLVPATQLQSNTSLLATLASIEDLMQMSDGGKIRENLGLLLSCQLAEIHGGEIYIQEWSDCGDRYVISLPQMVSRNDIVSH